MKHVYLLQHSYSIGEFDEVKTIGIYSSRQAAKLVVEKLKHLNGFKDHPEGFHINKFEIDSSNWVDGFIKWDDAL